MASEALTPKAGALREKLCGGTNPLLSIGEDRAIARAIVEKLGISEDHVDELRHAAGDSEACSRHGTAECVRDIANALSTLLELAGAKQGDRLTQEEIDDAISVEEGNKAAIADMGHGDL